ncbi:NAD(P)H-dependent flavin oxidoreductase [Pseudonocardia oroxyli]|uniref:Enoyl-[acyl-carrier protein] reductase II n=1 Tax=Pseudonocardia oroxyli TaxID=366584 RepID=A0A1G8D173_PSEOR|nr:nitronate monooxygenase [Pseudonocardia oroxyli]SDH51422.1 enoyl-[acyl-carrier protein] reductase II [Pseudonocardia oroxyli]
MAVRVVTCPLENRYTRLIGVRHPVVQEGMGPFRTTRLAAAVSEAGGLGTVSVPGAVGNLDEAAVELRRSVEECAAQTSQPFAVNIPIGQRRGGVAASALRYLDTVLQARRADNAIERQLRVVTTSAGFPEGLTARLHDEGLLHQHKVGSTRHARKAAAAGVDAVIAAGFEMGGHAPTSRMHTFVLVPNIADAVDVPVVLTGGVRDGRGLAAALCLGADAVALGTRFAVTTENTQWSAGYREAVLAAGESQDMVIDGVFGPCRVLHNKGADDIAAAQAAGTAHAAEKISAMRLAQIEGDVERGLVLMGQVASGITETVSAAELVEQMVNDAAAALGAPRPSSGEW